MSTASKLPNGWIETTFGEVVSAVSVNDKKLPKGQYLESGRFPVVDQGQQFIGGYSDDEARVISEDLPLLVFGDHTRAFKYLNQPFVPGADGVKVLKPIGVDAKWLYEIAHALEFPDKGYARHYQHLKSAKLFVPPLTEQRRIVAEIEKQFTRLEAGVAALRRVQANLKRYRAAVLKAACEGRLVPTEAELAKTGNRKAKFETGEALLARILTERRKNWQGRGEYKKLAAPDISSLPRLPDGWAVGSVDQLSGHITSGSRDWSQFYNRGTGTFILAQNVRPMRLDLRERQLVDAPKGDAETERTRVQRNDILVTIVGAKTGDVCRIPSDLKDHFVCQSVALLRPVLSDYAKFAELYLASQENGQAQWKRYIYGQGRPHLSFEQLRMTAIPLPPIAEQKRIVEKVEQRMSVVEELEAAVSANLQRATRLRQSILQKAFTGSSEEIKL